jgi:hypothetical protein
MKSKQEGVSGKETETAQIQRFQDMQFLPFQQSVQKNRSVFSGFRASEHAAPIATGVQEMGGKRESDFRHDSALFDFSPL